MIIITLADIHHTASYFESDIRTYKVEEFDSILSWYSQREKKNGEEIIKDHHECVFILDVHFKPCSLY